MTVANWVVYPKLSNPPTGTLNSCFTCGFDFLEGRGDGRFCCSRCRKYFDDGGSPYERHRKEHHISMPAGRHGFYIDCAHCGKRFESLGLKYCERCVTKASRKTANKDFIPLPVYAGKKRTKKRMKSKANSGQKMSIKKGR